jgi:hypothetical protein
MNDRDELVMELYYFKGLLYIEQNRQDNICGTTQLEILNNISEIEKKLEEMDKDDN